MGWRIRGSNPGEGEIFRTRSDRPWGPPSLLYDRYRVSFPGVKRPGRGVDYPPHLTPRLKKEYRYTSTPPPGLHGLFEGELYILPFITATVIVKMANLMVIIVITECH